MAQREQQRRIGVTFWSEVAAELADKLVCGHLAYLSKAEQLTTALPWEKFSRGQMMIWLSRGASAPGLISGGACNDGDDGHAVTFDDRNWQKVTDGLKLAGWESTKSNGTMKWSLTQEKRDALYLLHGRDTGPDISPMWRARRVGRGGVGQVVPASNDCSVSQCETVKNQGEATG